ncbi:MAG: hypothetical protein JWO38_3253 [Gemmataceae bacterium]|nr:hypothetical protein [Gemmataceae bacterium]
MNNGLIVLIVTIVIISAVVGAIAQFLNKLNESAKAPPPRRPAGAARGDATRQTDRDMDRFLAEIDRLRRKNAEAAEQQSQPAQPAPPTQPAGWPQSNRPAGVPPTGRQVPTRPGDRPRARVVADLVEPEAKPRRGVDTSPLAPPPLPVAPGTLSPSIRADDLPIATVVTPTSATGAPATRVTRLPQRARATPKTNLAGNLTGLLNSGQGVAMAIILGEILGPPKSKPNG